MILLLLDYGLFYNIVINKKLKFDSITLSIIFGLLIDQDFILIKMLNICFKLIKSSLKYKFIFHMIVNMIISTLFLPTIMKLMNDSFIGSDIELGLIYLIMFISIGIVVDLHSTFFIESLKRQFHTSLICDIEDYINRIINGFKWNQLRKLKKESIEERKYAAQWSIKNICEMTVSNLIQLFPFFGYSIWIFYISPFSLIAYIVGIYITIKLYPTKLKEDGNDNMELWERYHSISYGLFNETIHGKSEYALSEMKDCRRKIEGKKEIERSSDDKITTAVKSVFDMIFALNCLLFIPKFSVMNIMTYLQYTYIIKQYIQLIMSSINIYNDAYRDYNRFTDIILGCENKNNVKQCVSFNKLQITELKFKYPNNFELYLKGTLEFKRGEIIKLCGKSGSGKSSFVDILSGIYDNNDYIATLNIDDMYEPIGFNALNSIRCYTEQGQTISDGPCIYENITGNMFDDSQNDINNVYKVLEMTESTEFVSCQNNDDNKKWIGMNKPGLSGGQRARIKLAKSLYQIIKLKPQMIILDEVDTNIQPDMLVTIMTNIFKYCKDNKILTFIVGHTTEVSNMTYDKIIRFNNGCIESKDK